MTANKIPLKKPVGRPVIKVDNRCSLIDAARKLFVDSDYEKVSIRAIAAEAKVDASLIRYYFQSKMGLFTEMLRETIEPVHSQLSNSNQSSSHDSPEKILLAYYEIMSKNPDFPKLIFRTASLPPTDINKELQASLLRLFPSKRLNIFEKMDKQNQLQSGIDPMCAKMSFISLMVFPFLMPNLLKQAMNIDTSAEFLQQLAKHNTQLLRHGLIANESQPSQDA
ncbi:TetR/AcrR family transcriptional regulator [Shewanella donghaensis]|uniref:TetR/AcrR family transcriptional regulator n=1 Tax=Shewanella donghaensis TaxID=238836 RepID=UPI0011823740|nr:TetR/AcrR family transcriptional regulator [Shewanella donghaensis]